MRESSRAAAAVASCEKKGVAKARPQLMRLAGLHAKSFSMTLSASGLTGFCVPVAATARSQNDAEASVVSATAPALGANEQSSSGQFSAVMGPSRNASFDMMSKALFSMIHGQRPVDKQSIWTPSAHRSTAGEESARPSNRSGALTYSVVISWCSGRKNPWAEWALPMSATFTLPLLVTSMFFNEASPWVMPMLCKCRRPSATPTV